MKIFTLIVLSTALASSGLSATNSLYKTNCASCHGVNGEKSALGKSKPIQGMPSDKVIKALEEYSSGSRPSALPVAKSIKQKFISRYKKEEIKEVADYISKL